MERFCDIFFKWEPLVNLQRTFLFGYINIPLTLSWREHSINVAKRFLYCCGVLEKTWFRLFICVYMASCQSFKDTPQRPFTPPPFWFVRKYGGLWKAPSVATYCELCSC